MTDQLISQLTQATPDPTDVIPFVDVSDTTMGSGGTTKKTLVSNLNPGITIGDTITGGTAGSIPFIGASSVLAQSNANLNVDTTTFTMGIGTTAGGNRVTIRHAVGNGISAANSNIVLEDSTSQTTGVGGVLTLMGAYSGTTNTLAVAVKASKANSTAGNYDFNLAFYARQHGISGVTEYMRLRGSDGALNIDNTIELGHATDTTISRSSAGVIAVEGVVIPSISSTNTLTNKAVTRRVVTTTSDTTAVIDVTVTDDYELTAMAGDTTFSTTGTPTDGQMIMIRFKDNATPRALTWTGITALGVTLPTTTVASKQHLVGIKYFTSLTAWKAIAVSVEA